MARPTWTLTGPLSAPHGAVLAGTELTLSLVTGVSRDPSGSDLRAGSTVAVVGADGTLTVKGTGDPVMLLASSPDAPVHYRLSCIPRVLPTVTFTAPEGGTLALDDIVPEVPAPIPPVDASTLRAEWQAALAAALDAFAAALGAELGTAAASDVGDFATAAQGAKADTASQPGHGHVIADTTGLQAALDGKQPAGSYAAGVHTHTAAQIADATTAGRALVTAADAAAQRTALGLGSAATTAATDYATAAAVGKVRGATVIVKADGSGDYATPEAALAAIGAAGGGTVLLRAGTYQTQGMVVPSNTILRGEGASTVIRSNNSAPWNTISTANNGSNILIADLAVDGNRANQALAAFSTVVINSSRTIVRGCWITGSPGYALVSYGQPGTSGNDLVFSGNVIYDNAKEGIETQGSSRVAITGNVVRNCGHNSILVWANTAQGGASSDVTITGNTVSGYGLLATSSGIRIDDGATDVTITGNTVSGAGRANCYGILVQSATAAPVKRVTVMGNVISESSAFGPTGIAHVGSGGGVTGNTVTGCSTGINIPASATDIAVTGNTVSACTGNGINISGAGVTLASNIVTGCGGTTYSGINIGGADATATGNRVTGSGSAGIAFVAGGSGTCSGNAVTGSRGCGIGVFNTSNVAVTGNISTNNGIATQQHGVFVTQWSTGVVSGVIVTGNRCCDSRTTGKTQQYGVRVSGVVTDTHIGPNVHTGNSVAGQLVDGGATVTTLAP